jgi:hypothetical protein
MSTTPNGGTMLTLDARSYFDDSFEQRVADPWISWTVRFGPELEAIRLEAETRQAELEFGLVS